LNGSLFALLLVGPLACSGTKGDTESGSETEAATEATAGGEPTGGEPAACDDTDPKALARFEVEIDGNASDHEVDLPCTVDAVATEEATSVTTLTCDQDGSPVAVVLRLPEAPEGPVSWAAGDGVQLASRFEDLDVTAERHLELRGDNDALLAAGFAPHNGSLIAEIFAPLTVTAVAACGPVEEFDGELASYRLDFSLAGQTPVSVFSGNRADLPIDGGESFAIDVEIATYNECCHASEGFVMLVRRVKTG